MRPLSMLKLLLAGSIAIGSPSGARGQSTPASLAAPSLAPTLRQRVSLSAALLTESAKFYPASFNPGVLVGADVPWVSRRGHALVQTASLGYFYHADLAHALTLQTELGYRHTFRFGLTLELMLGLALLHKFPTTRAYGLEEGRYREDSSGASSFFPSLSAGFGYDFSRMKRPVGFALFARYQVGVEVPGAYGVPAYPHTQIVVGARVPLAR
jgi:hypothetical protein